jgi:hypothetical protein
MTRTLRTMSVVLVLVLCAAAAPAQADRLQPTRISLIKANWSAYLNERVRIDGFVTQFVDAGTRSTSFYSIKDDWGSVVKVRTSKQAPLVGKRYSIEGPVGIDPRTKDLFISEETRLEAAIAQETAPSTQAASGETVAASAATKPSAAQPPPVTATPNEAGTPTLMYVAIGSAAAIILALGLILAFRSRSADGLESDFSSASASPVEAPPAPEQVIEGKTIKLHAPPPNTVKLLPGWFEVVSGDDVVKQIRFYKLGGEHGAETTFGRASGRPYAHIQLKATTVSSRQAKVTFDNGSAQLTNFASNDSNPTNVNGRDLGVNESVPLRESDRVEMGEVTLLFHEAPSAATLTR